MFRQIAIGLVATLAMTTPASAAATSPLEFAKLFVHQIFESEQLRRAGEAEQASTTDTTKQFVGCVRNMSLLQTEYSSQSLRMAGVQLAGSGQQLPQQFAELWRQKSEAYGTVAAICTKLLSGPEPGVNYGALTAEMPRQTARLQSIDHTILEASPVVFLLMVADKGDSRGHANHLVVTNKERTELVSTIDRGFPGYDGKPDMPQLVAAVFVLRDGLAKKGFKSADEPW